MAQVTIITQLPKQAHPATVFHHSEKDPSAVINDRRPTSPRKERTAAKAVRVALRPYRTRLDNRKATTSVIGASTHTKPPTTRVSRTPGVAAASTARAVGV